MANRRMFTGYGNDQGTQPQSHASESPDMQPSEITPLGESPRTFRRRVTPVIGEPTPSPSTLQDLLAMLRGGTSGR